MAVQHMTALDIGGANIKVATLDQEAGNRYRTTSAVHVFPVWQRAGDLADFLRNLCRAHSAGALAVTLTAELADVFPTKREGVDFVLKAVQEACPGMDIYVITVDGELERLEDALKNPLQAAGANWAASAWAAARLFPEGILGDTGSTTTDLIPFSNGKINARGRTDPERLSAGELVYTGILRTPCSSLAVNVPLRGSFCRVSPEYFTITGDMHLILGNIQPADYQWPTPDGRGNTPDCASARLARLVCGDGEMLSECEITRIARYLYDRQVQQVADALYQVQSRFERPLPLICAGSGLFLLDAAAVRAGLRAIRLDSICGAGPVSALPAWSLCLMLAEQVGGVRVFEQFKDDA